MRTDHKKRPPTEYALLGFLTDGPRHGYDIYQEISEPGGLWLVWRMKHSQLYALLARLEDRGLLNSYRESEGSRPPRKMFQLTSSGREAFQHWMTAPVGRGRQIRLDLLTKLFFALREGSQAVENLLKAQRNTCESWLNDLQKETEEISEGETYRRVVHEYRIGQIRAVIDWLDTCMQEFEQSPSSAGTSPTV